MQFKSGLVALKHKSGANFLRSIYEQTSINFKSFKDSAPFIFIHFYMEMYFRSRFDSKLFPPSKVPSQSRIVISLENGLHLLYQVGVFRPSSGAQQGLKYDAGPSCIREVILGPI